MLQQTALTELLLSFTKRKKTINFSFNSRMSTYSSTQQTGNNANSEALFQKHSQTIATSIQKILQNGKKESMNAFSYFFHLKIEINCVFTIVSTMNRMVNQIGTVQETNDLRPQL